jgi:hypothetical protein
MSEIGKGTCGTATAATVADSTKQQNELEHERIFAEEAEFISKPLLASWQRLIHPLLQRLDQHTDCRLIYTFERLLLSIFRHRNRSSGLLLTELGAVLSGPHQAPAGTKRISNLLRSQKWRSDEIGDYLWEHAVATWEDMVAEGTEALMLWDDSVIEKPESLQCEGLCPVRSSKAKRLTRIKPGYYRPPGAPIFVPGFQWSTLLLIGRKGPPTLAAMRWWGTRQPNSEPNSEPNSPLSDSAPSDSAPRSKKKTSVPLKSAPVTSPPVWFSRQRDVAKALLEKCAQTFELGVIHIFDRGYAGEPWLNALDHHDLRFVLRWPKNYQLQALSGVKKAAWKHLRGKRFSATFQINDGPGKREREVRLKAIQVFHAGYGGGKRPLWLVVSTPGKGREPWYLLTNEPISSMEDAFHIVTAYARRWQIEGCFRFNKTELALESPRLWSWERRLKLLMIVSLVYVLLLNLLNLPQSWREAIFRQCCHRTGKRSRNTPTPLYRLRTALAFLTSTGCLDIPFYKSPG